MKTLNFLMGLHCHQPVDNLEVIFKNAYRKSYDPFLRVLAEHPKIKLAFHYSGPLLDWIVRNKPDYIMRVRKLIERGQVEILTGGYFEPVLPMIPAEDTKGQIKMLTRLIEKHFNRTPRGAWLAERVWDPELARIFNDLNIRYTILDDFHLKQARVKEEHFFGHYSVKGSGNFSIFAAIKKLRYTMPFRDVGVTMDFLEKLHERGGADSITFVDDCEKFGFWPYTYDWVYKKGWLEKFFTALEKSDRIKTLTFTEALRECESLGDVDIPESSYAEMVEWANGNFNNFFSKYPEGNRMRNRMLCVSEKLRGNTEERKEELYKAQSNCAYWHGIFGGIYTNYLRHGVYGHIIKAENSIADENSDGGIDTVRFKDGTENIRLQNKFLALFVDPAYGGSLSEIDYKPIPYNLADTMSRRYEPYHEKLRKKKRIDVACLKQKLYEGESVDLHEILGVRERNLNKFLNYDPYQKFSCICYAMDFKTSFEDFVKSVHVDTCENGFFGPYSCQTETKSNRLVVRLERSIHQLRLTKCIILERDSEIYVKFDLENISAEPVKFIFGAEFNWSLEDKSFMRPRQHKGIRRISLRDKYSGITADHIFGIPVDLWSFPVYTLNESERGLGKSFQEISLLFHRGLVLGEGTKFSLDMTIRISECSSKKRLL